MENDVFFGHLTVLLLVVYGIQKFFFVCHLISVWSLWWLK